MTAPTLEERFIALLHDHRKLIYKACHTYTNRREDFKDLEQEIIMQLWAAFPLYNPEYKISTWLYRIALNTAISFYRKEKQKPQHNAISAQIMEIIPDAQADATSQQNEQIDALHDFIQGLGEMNKALILLYLEEHSYREIAEILGISETNVATKLNRIKIMIKKHFSHR